MAGRQQFEDGSWYTAYLEGQPIDKTRDTNLCAYIAVGVWHYYLVTADDDFPRRDVADSIGRHRFCDGLPDSRRGNPLGHQPGRQGRPDGIVDRLQFDLHEPEMRTGHCRLRRRLKKPHWRAALERLGNAIRTKPHLFNMTKSRYAMDWFYPVLAGALTGDAAQRRIDQYWKKFVIEANGCTLRIG